MADFHKLLMVKTKKMIKKKTGLIFLVVYVIYNSLLYTDSKKAVSCLLPRLPASHLLCNFYKVIKCNFVRIQIGLCLFHYVLDNQSWLVFVCFVQFNNQLDV